MILQGPILQFVKKSHTTSSKKLSEFSCASDISHLLNVLNEPELLTPGENSREENILISLRILFAGIFSITKLNSVESVSKARQSLGRLFKKLL